MMVEILKSLLNQAGVITVFILALSQVRVVRHIFAKPYVFKEKPAVCVIVVIFFGVLGIAETYLGIPVHGAIANSRVVAVFVAGLLGGPVIGLLSGLIAGLHRWAIDIGGFTSVACMSATIIEGLLGGLLSRTMQRVELKWQFAMVTGAFAELLHMLIVLLLARPFSAALELVSIIAVPMIVANSIAIAVFIAIIEGIKKEQERAAATQAKIIFRIVRKTLQYLKKGFTQETARASARIILENTDLAAVSFSNREIVLSHVGAGEAHHLPGESLYTDLCKKAIKTKRIQIANSKEKIHCNARRCTFNSAVIVPLFRLDEIVGTLNLYREEKNAITAVDIKLAKGFASLFSTQIELSRIEEQKKLLEQAELKALQSQINPHFLFNAINTIGSLIRTDPEKARILLQYLGAFFRKNSQQLKGDVSIYKEIEHIKSYLEIEKARFGNKLKVNFKIPEDLEFQIPPLLLQPLVENAVKHGIMVRKQGGQIKVEVKEGKHNIVFLVRDNGIGIKKNQLSRILLPDDQGGISALQNINRRLVTKYGDKYGLTINSRRGEGTMVSIRIPKGVA